MTQLRGTSPHCPTWCVLCMKPLEFDPGTFGQEPTTLPDGCVAHHDCWDTATADDVAAHSAGSRPLLPSQEDR